MILPDIPQGAIKIASAILAVAGGAPVTFAVFLTRELFSVKERLKGVATQVTPDDAERMKTANIRLVQSRHSEFGNPGIAEESYGTGTLA